MASIKQRIRKYFESTGNKSAGYYTLMSAVTPGPSLAIAIREMLDSGELELVVGKAIVEVVPSSFYSFWVLVNDVTEHLDRGDQHYRDCNGELIRTLDQWVQAVIAGRWPAANGH